MTVAMPVQSLAKPPRRTTKGRRFFVEKHATPGRQRGGCGRPWRGVTVWHRCCRHQGGYCCCSCGAWDRTPGKSEADA